MENLAHFALRELCVRFYYKKKKSIGPAQFKHLIPELAIVLCATCVIFPFYLLSSLLNFVQLYNCLNEYRLGSYKLVAFEGKTYLPIFLGIGAAINTMNDDLSDTAAYHAEKFRANRIQWHNAAM